MKTKQTEEVSRAKNLWLNNSYKNQTSLVDWVTNQEGFSLEENSSNLGFVLPRNIMEYHSVNSWLANKLREEGEFLIEFKGEYFWGRQTTGQSVWLDYIIQKIFDNWKEGIKT